ncbi:hypothetical protein B0J11DRAFT_118506 [Dendryphion nanum]|uniref:Uncharacterized protein n=1 Tax=Dendryphion nanum TaxID=256645 RepID=A0A9P9IC64_9PLEO|nr:hypothetical protein B0J11DRAFT_118506 [Dendryphion nanum]
MLICIDRSVLGACVADLNGLPQTKWSRRVIQATNIAPSLWPIIFSSVLGNAVRTVADWRVERGVSLLTLEQLMGSLTMASSVITIFRWSLFRISSLALVIIWAFNPLGSQASLRIAFPRKHFGITHQNITYYNASLETQMQLTYGLPKFRDTPKVTIRTLYASVLVDYIASLQYVDPTHPETIKVVEALGGNRSAGSQASTDTWGNIRIPNLDYYSENTMKDSHGWLDVPWNEKILNYSSLLGDRVDGINRTFDGNTTFEKTSSYWRFNCTPWTHLDTAYKNISNSSEVDRWFRNQTGTNFSTINTSQPQFGHFFLSRLPDVAGGLESSNPYLVNLMFLANLNRNVSVISATKCSGQMTYVDARVLCVSKGLLGKSDCGVTKLRRTPDPPGNPRPNIYEPDRRIDTMCDNFMNVQNDVRNEVSSSLNELYIMDPLDVYNNRPVNVSSLDIPIFERRFSLLWNTLWKMSCVQNGAKGGNFSIPTLYQRQRSIIVQNGTSEVIRALPPVYEIDRFWLTVYFLSVAIMCFTAVFSLVVRSQCHAPVLLRYTSSLMRDSPYFEGRDLYTNSTEEGSDKSKRLSGLQVRIADVQVGKDGPPKIVFAPADLGRMVQKGRWYE